VLYKGEHGRVAHECIIDLRPLEHETHISAEDVAKRLMDFGFHAPTLSFPVAGTLMIEPTESESLAELERFCQAMIQIHGEISAVKDGRSDAHDNPLKHAPHTAAVVAGEWGRSYSREQAAHSRRRGCANASSGPTSPASTTSTATAISSARVCRWRHTPSLRHALFHQTNHVETDPVCRNLFEFWRELT
jgi:hypothetical protein